MSSSLFRPYTRGALSLANRIAMAPMTRSRAPGNVPNALMAEYYAQRASAGLVITEGTAPSADGLGYARIPGLFTDAQQAGWAAIAEAAHGGGAALFVQLMHTGRIGHPLNLPEGAELLAPSAIAAAGEMWTDQAGMQPHPVPRALRTDEIARVQRDFVQAARRARAAGVDGVELHGANGYLIGQFLNPRSNQREDAYGGSAENRRRFLLELVDQVSAEIGAERVGVRLSPFNPFNDLAADYPGEREEFLALVAALSARGIGYLHLTGAAGHGELLAAARKAFAGTLVTNGGLDAKAAEAILATGDADLVAFGRPFIANPDLPERLRSGAALAEGDPGTFYTPGAAGYTDYPALDSALA